MHTFESWLVELTKAKIDYILVGGLAVDLCGYARSTLDMDILIAHNSENIGRLIAALEKFGRGSGSELTEDDLSLEEGCVRVNEDFPLDIFTVMSGKTYEDMIPFSDVTDVAGAAVRHISPEGIIMLKSSSSRPKDKLDVEAMRELKKKK